MKMKKCLLFIFAIFYLYILSEALEIELLFEKDLKNLYDLSFHDDLTLVTIPQKFIIFNSQGNKLLQSQKIAKSSSEALLLDDKIIFILKEKQLLQVYNGDSLLNEVDLKEHEFISFLLVSSFLIQKFFC